MIQEQRRIAVWGKNAGGIGKTTLSTVLAYHLASLGLNVCIIELDATQAVSVASGVVEISENPKYPSLVDVFEAYFRKEFKGDWPLIRLWQEDIAKIDRAGKFGAIDYCYGGGDRITRLNEQLASRRGKEFILKSLLEKPLSRDRSHDAIIFDCAAGETNLVLNAFYCASHVLVPFKPEEIPANGAASLPEWFRELCFDLKLFPSPPLAFVPIFSCPESAPRRDLIQRLRDVSKILSPPIPCFSTIRYSSEFNNAIVYGGGKPLQIYRPKRAKEVCLETLKEIANFILEAQ